MQTYNEGNPFNMFVRPAIISVMMSTNEKGRPDEHFLFLILSTSILSPIWHLYLPTVNI